MVKTKSLDRIDRQMKGMDKDSIRYHILQSVKQFKTSWIDLGQALYSVWKDKLFKEWGYRSFENYTSREIGIRKQTAMKLLRSYYFLEKEEPSYLEKDYTESSEVSRLPTYEAVDVLRIAKNKKTLDDSDYDSLKEKVFHKGKAAVEVKKDLTQLLKERQELEPEEARRKRREATVKRLLSTLKTLKRDVELLKLLPAKIIDETNRLIQKIEAEI